MHDLSKVRVIQVHPTAFSAADIRAYEREVLENPKATEHTASKFFFRFPKFLFFGSGKQLKREVLVLNPIVGGKKGRVDFFSQAYGRDDWDIIELKKPNAPFLKKKGNDFIPSDYLANAIVQANRYREMLVNNFPALDELATKGIKISRPRMLAIVGRSPHVSRESIELVKEIGRNSLVESYTYDDILEIAKDAYASTQTIVLPINIDKPVVYDTFDNTREALLRYPLLEDSLEEMTMSMCDYVGENWSKSEPTPVPLVRMLKINRGFAYFLISSHAEAVSVLGSGAVGSKAHSDHPVVFLLGYRKIKRNSMNRGKEA